MSPKQSNNQMHYKIFDNLAIKLVVLCLAFLVWYFVKMEDNYQYQFQIPLRITNLGPDRIINSDIPRKIKIISWGRGKDLFSLMLRKDLFYDLDVSRVKKSAKIVLEKNQIKFLHKRDIEILNIVDPETVTVTITRLITRKVPVVPEVQIQTLPGYTVVGPLKLEPDSVEVVGPPSAIKTITAVHTQKKLYRKIKRDLEKKIRLLKPPFEHVKILTDEVYLTVDVQKLMEKKLYEIPVAVINTPRNLKVTVLPSTLSLVLEGGSDLLLNVTKKDVKAYIDYQKVRYSRKKSHLAYIVAPEGTRYRDVKPKRFSIVVETIRQ